MAKSEEAAGLTVQEIPASDPVSWNHVLEKVGTYDWYHSAEYHRLAEDGGEGEARLVVFEDAGVTIALPLLLRRIDGTGLFDATSVYGYPGPVSSRPEIAGETLDKYRAAIRSYFSFLQVVSVFSRLHPLLPQAQILQGLGECSAVGTTVSIDLRLSLSEQRAKYRKGHRYEINQLNRRRVVCQHDEDFAHLTEFSRIYSQTMARLGAAPSYRFDYEYLGNLVERLRGMMHLFVCTYEGEVVCGGLFTLCQGIVQYHLSGTSDGFVSLSPTKLMLDTVRVWGASQGARVFHLGGGVGAAQDSLFHFKAGFTDRRHQFSVWRWVVLPDRYEDLCAERAIAVGVKGKNDLIRQSSFFPAYRAPLPRNDEIGETQ